MGESKIPIYAFVDETGNTGHNLFDEAQPDFWTAALVTKGDFDAVYGDNLKAIAAKVGKETLHATELGMAGIEALANRLLELFQRSSAHFFVSRVEKHYLLATKMFDSLFDSGENAAVGWHNYNFRPLRIVLAFKFASILDLGTARLFWKCIMEPKEDKALEMLPQICELAMQGIHRLPDARSRQIISDGLEWAKEHPEAIQIHTDRQTVRKGHFPNLVAFTNLLSGLEDFSIRWNRKVARISHDEQTEMKATLELYHSIASNAPNDVIEWAGERYSLQKAANSEFRMLSDDKSAGIQIADLVLWLYAKFRKGHSLPVGCSHLLDFVFQHGWESDFSFEGVEKVATEKMNSIMTAPFPPEKERFAKKLLEHYERNRRASIAQYEKDKVPPFMRASKKTELPD